MVRTSQNLIKTSSTINNFEYRLECGRVNSNSAKTTPGILLIGGAASGKSGEDAATRWLLKLANGGNFLVLRSGKIGKQASWISDNYRDFVSSAAELSINSRDAGEVIEYIRDADALFLAGGNQSQYKEYWEGTAVEDAINYLINQKQVPVAGTSAGMAILGDFYYAPIDQGLISSEILNNPFHQNTKNIYRSDFIRIPFLKNEIRLMIPT